MKTIQIAPADNVAVALCPINAGETVQSGDLSQVVVTEAIPQGHKIALKNIAKEENIIKYGFVIGHATTDIPAGSWVHTHNMATNLSGEIEYSYHSGTLSSRHQKSRSVLTDFRRKDGRAAIRNEIWIIPTVGCVNDVAKRMTATQSGSCDRNDRRSLYIPDHPFGCSQTGHDHAQTRKLLAALVRHPNAAAVLVLGLGCENLTHEQFVEELGDYDADRVKFLTCQEVEDEFEAGRKLIGRMCQPMPAQFHREPIPVSELVVGMKCGGSDGLSGITANPAVGRFSDMLAARGGSTVLTEVPEMFGAEGFLNEPLC